jgi:hypothetical protein
MPAVSITPAFQLEFENAFRMVTQQTESRLKKFVTMVNFKGKLQRCTYFAADEDPEEVTERAGATQVTDLAVTNRWMGSKLYAKAHRFDEYDGTNLGDMPDLQGPLMRSIENAFARHCDSRIISAVRDAAITGTEDALTTTAFGASQTIAVNATAPGVSATNSNITIEKLIQARELLTTNEVFGQDINSLETPVCAIGPKQVSALLRINEFKSGDYNYRALMEGEINPFLGMRFVVVPTRLPVASSVRECLIWMPSGIQFRFGEHRADVDVLPTQSHSIQARVRALSGGVRLEEVKALKVFCDETL